MLRECVYKVRYHTEIPTHNLKTMIMQWRIYCLVSSRTGNGALVLLYGDCYFKCATSWLALSRELHVWTQQPYDFYVPGNLSKSETLWNFLSALHPLYSPCVVYNCGFKTQSEDLGAYRGSRLIYNLPYISLSQSRVV